MLRPCCSRIRRSLRIALASLRVASLPPRGYGFLTLVGTVRLSRTGTVVGAGKETAAVGAVGGVGGVCT